MTYASGTRNRKLLFLSKVDSDHDLINMAMAIRRPSPPLDYSDSDFEDDNQDELVSEIVNDAN